MLEKLHVLKLSALLSFFLDKKKCYRGQFEEQILHENFNFCTSCLILRDTKFEDFCFVKEFTQVCKNEN